MAIQFSTLVDPTQKYAYVQTLLTDQDQLKDADVLGAELKKIDQDSLFALTQWMIQSVCSWRTGSHEADAYANRFDEAFQETRAELPLTEEQLQQLDILWYTRHGIKGTNYESLSEEVRLGFEGKLNAFLGDDTQIDAIDTMEKARGVAFELFSGKRCIDSSRFIPHMNHFLYVGAEGDIASIKYVMHSLRERQKEHFKKNGFLRESSTLPIPTHPIDPLKNKQIEIVIAGGKRLLQTFRERTSNGSRFYGEQAGIQVSIKKHATWQLELTSQVEEARRWAQAHCDEAVMLVATVSEKYLVESAHGKATLYPEALDSLRIYHTIQVPYCPTKPLATKDLFLTLKRTNEWRKMYLDLISNQLHGETISRLLTTQIDDTFTPPDLPPIALRIPNPPQDPEVTQWTTYAKGAAVILGLFLTYKYVIRPNYPKLEEWWNRRQSPA